MSEKEALLPTKGKFWNQFSS